MIFKKQDFKQNAHIQLTEVAAISHQDIHMLLKFSFRYLLKLWNAGKH